MSFTDSETLVGITDIAEMARAKRAAVSNWPKRYPDFPKPRTSHLRERSSTHARWSAG